MVMLAVAYVAMPNSNIITDLFNKVCTFKLWCIIKKFHSFMQKFSKKVFLPMSNSILKRHFKAPFNKDNLN